MDEGTASAGAERAASLSAPGRGLQSTTNVVNGEIHSGALASSIEKRMKTREMPILSLSGLRVNDSTIQSSEFTFRKQIVTRYI